MSLEPGEELDPADRAIDPSDAGSGDAALSAEEQRRQRRRTTLVLSGAVVLFGAGVFGLGLPSRNDRVNVHHVFNRTAAAAAEGNVPEPEEAAPPIFAGFTTPPRGDLITGSAPPVILDTSGTTGVAPTRATSAQTSRASAASSTTAPATTAAAAAPLGAPPPTRPVPEPPPVTAPTTTTAPEPTTEPTTVPTTPPTEPPTTTPTTETTSLPTTEPVLTGPPST